MFCSVAFYVWQLQKKASNSNNIPQNHLNGGYSLGTIKGLFDIAFSKNCDTTVIMAVTVYAIVYSYSPLSVGVSFRDLPADIETAQFATPGLLIPPSPSYATDSATFRIHASDTGSFTIRVFATAATNPAEISDSFKLVVH